MAYYEKMVQFEQNCRNFFEKKFLKLADSNYRFKTFLSRIKAMNGKISNMLISSITLLAILNSIKNDIRLLNEHLIPVHINNSYLWQIQLKRTSVIQFSLCTNDLHKSNKPNYFILSIFIYHKTIHIKANQL